MTWRQRIGHAVVSQFHRPRGIAGRVVGWEMALRSSNRKRNRWAITLLDIKPTDRFLELGFGPGLAIRAASRLATSGIVIGIDHSEEMVRQATRRSADAVRSGRVTLHMAAADNLPAFPMPFDKVLAVNSIGFWPHPVERLIEIRSIMSDHGVIGVVSQPRCPGATQKDTDRAEQQIREQLGQAGYAIIGSERLNLDPPVCCVLATSWTDHSDAEGC